MIDPKVRDRIDSEHPHLIDGVRTDHILDREGDMITCSCGGDPIHAPILPKPTPTPMEASLSRFD